ncbi:RNA polymerase subunit sigma-24 [Pseudoalteromonas rubra]|uniref:RNA polymerase subunit sigma-24 n=1 Tax=Pseudoalteromonas rubra TaxID=43658 RepID=A0A5S3WMG5_9GAMM|nr:RNA polymerase sigma factor [Pseudoalteromonas rubra]TMP28175.1 RNA polymerase subunit sigma-24 [Pseudoalteromonas rubra]TMP34877.1 RNA polymerase subunit sigma-24 [Pseudoalteromonas rubra]
MKPSKAALLVLSAQQGNRRAFETLCEAFYQPSWRFAMKLSGQRACADDICQDVWTSVAKKLGQLKEPSAFRAWVFRAIYRRFISQKQNESRFEDSQPEQAYETPDLDTSLSILALIHQLGDDERHCVYLFYLEQMSLRDIANILDVPQGTVKSRLNRARAQLHAMVNEEQAS